MRCNGCGAGLDLSLASCPACGAEVELGRLTGILGVVCRACDAYNDPGARVCAACGGALDGAEPAAAEVASAPAPSPRAAPPPAVHPARPGEPTWFTPPGTAAPRPQAPSRATTLVLERGAGRPGTTFALDGEVSVVGREGALAFPDDPCLAPRHATLVRRGDALHVRDEGAEGGVFLRLRGLSVPLRPGDLFAVGDRLLRYGGPLPPAPPPGPDGTRRLGAPRPPAGSVLLEERLEGGVAGRVHVHPGPAVRIGARGCAVALEDPLVSPEHAEILLDGDGGARLRDLGSATGTYLRIPPHGERELRDGDALRVGREVLRVALG